MASGLPKEAPPMKTEQAKNLCTCRKGDQGIAMNSSCPVHADIVRARLWGSLSEEKRKAIMDAQDRIASRRLVVTPSP